MPKSVDNTTVGKGRTGNSIRLMNLTKDYKKSFYKYAKACLKIQDTDGNLVPFVLNGIQKIINNIICDIEDRGLPIRIIILKARREGISTYFNGRFFWKTTLSRNRYAMVIAHEPEATDFLFKMHKRFYANLIDEFKPQTKYNNKKMLEFNNEENQGLDSAIRVGTAGKADFGSSQLVHFLHLSEAAKYSPATATPLLTSLLQTIPDKPETEVVMESTAKGIGGEFYDRYFDARYTYRLYLDKTGKLKQKNEVRNNTSPDNKYVSIFVPWFAFDEYRLPVDKHFEPTKDEEKLKKLYNISNEQLRWRRYAIENKCNRSEKIFRQEYPSNEEECFIGSSLSPFDSEKVAELRASAPKPIVRYNYDVTTNQFLASKEGSLLVWKEPKMQRYIVSADPAEGISTGDYSSADVIDILTGEQVAHWHGHIDADMFGKLLLSLAIRYNSAIICPERNPAGGGIIVINTILDTGYRNVYVETVVDPPAKPRKRYGWVTSKKTKYPIIANLSNELRDNTHGINCKATFDEMLSYKQNDDGTLGAESGRHDDRVMSIAIGKYIRTRLPIIGQKKTENNFVVNMATIHRTPKSAVGWT